MWNKSLNGTLREGDLLNPDILLPLFADRLPDTWRVAVAPSGQLRTGPDALITLTPPKGASVLLAVESRLTLSPKTAKEVADQLQVWSTGPGLVVAPFVSVRSRDTLRERRVGYADLTGNLYLQIDDPPLYISDHGDDSNPSPTPGRVRSLRGQGAAKAIRAFVDFRTPYGLRELAEASGAPIASLSRIGKYLTDEGLIQRLDQGGVESVDWKGVLKAWAEDYSPMRSNVVYSYLEPRGLPHLRNKIARAPRSAWVQYALTGSIAAQELAPYAPAAVAMIYAQRAKALAEVLDLRATDRGANVFILAPSDGTPLERLKSINGLQLAAPTQIAADLLSGPGRSQEEASALIHWMELHQEQWQRSTR